MKQPIKRNGRKETVADAGVRRKLQMSGQASWVKGDCLFGLLQQMKRQAMQQNGTAACYMLNRKTKHNGESVYSPSGP